LTETVSGVLAPGSIDIVVAQVQSPGSNLGLGTRIGIRFGVGFLLNLVLGGLVVGLSPTYATRRVADIREDPGEAFLWGLLVGIVVPIFLVILAVTVVGLVITIPGLIVLAFVGLTALGVTVAWIGDALTGDSGTQIRAKSIVVGALVLAIPGSIPVLGNVLVSIIQYFALGAVGRHFLQSWSD
jgi:hypothetical protein